MLKLEDIGLKAEHALDGMLDVHVRPTSTLAAEKTARAILLSGAGSLEGIVYDIIIERLNRTNELLICGVPTAGVLPSFEKAIHEEVVAKLNQILVSS